MRKSVNSLIVTIGPPHDKPWWWRYIRFNQKCDVTYYRMTIGDKKGSQISTRDIPSILAKMINILFLQKKKYDYIYTFECDMTTFIISLLQTVTFQRRPKHVVLTFIMREKENNVKSKLKYLLMKFLFLSVHKVVCSSRREADYYNSIFNWKDKAVYVPLPCEPDYLDRYPVSEVEDYIVSAGRTFRDYDTLLKSMEGIDIKLIIVASPGTLNEKLLPDNVQLLYDITMDSLNDLIKRSRFVVLPLEDRVISTGQSVLLQAMAMGKCVLATLTSGTEGYFEQMESGVYVAPGDAVGLKKAISQLYNDTELCSRIGANAAELVKNNYSPQSYHDQLVKILDTSR